MSCSKELDNSCGEMYKQPQFWVMELRWFGIGGRKKKGFFLLVSRQNLYLVGFYSSIHTQLYHAVCEKTEKNTRIIQRKSINVKLLSLPIECELNEGKELSFGLAT